MFPSYKNKILKSVAAILVLVACAGSASAQDKKPNILVIWGDDIGW